MAGKNIMILVFLLLVPLVFHPVTAHEGRSKGKSSVVEGMVYCQSCKELGTASLSGAQHNSNATVGINCRNKRGYSFYSKEYTTNEGGYFYAELDYDVGHYLFDHPIHACKVYLVSSSMSSCNLPTNINSGISGASLKREEEKSRKKDCKHIYYSAGPFAFRPAECTSDETNY